MSWALLILAVVLDVLATVMLKHAGTVTRAGPEMLLALAMFAASVWAVAGALRSLDLVPVYVVWVGLGTAIAAVAGGFLYGERVSRLEWAAILLIALGVLGVAWAGQRETHPPLPDAAFDVQASPGGSGRPAA